MYLLNNRLTINLKKKITEFQIPWDMSDPEIRGVNALGLWDRDLLMSDQPGYIGC